MSNVLIGIIGVILFIGLALAGALILGDDFKSASSASTAATLMSQMKQASDAADMRKLKLGVSHTPSTSTDAAGFLIPRFLKSPASNPVAAAKANPSGYPYGIQFNNNLYMDGSAEPTLSAKYLVGPIGPVGDAKSKDICQAISETYGIQTIPDYSGNSDPHPASQAGCVIGYAFASTNYYMAYIRVSPTTQGTMQASGF